MATESSETDTPGTIQPKIAWAEIEELNRLHGKAVARLPSAAPWRDHSEQSNANWVFHRTIEERWGALYAELKDAYKGE